MNPRIIARIAQCLKTLAKYGGAARPVLPGLRKIETQLRAHREARGLQKQIDLVRGTITAIETAKNSPALREIKPQEVMR